MVQNRQFDDSPEAQLKRLMFGDETLIGRRRFTQGSPATQNVWETFWHEPDKPHDLLLVPHRSSGPVELARGIRERRAGFREAAPSLASDQGHEQLAYNDTYVVGEFTFAELINILLPLTAWFSERVMPGQGDEPDEQVVERLAGSVRETPGSEKATKGDGALPPDLVWLARLAGSIRARQQGNPFDQRIWETEDSSLEAEDEVRARLTFGAESRRLAEIFVSLAQYAFRQDRSEPPVLWLANVNRPARLAVWRSRQAVKADVAELTFRLNFGGIRWAVLDSGIDAQHPAFRRREDDGKLRTPDWQSAWHGETRILETYDFSHWWELLRAKAGDPLLAQLTAPQRQKLKVVKEGIDRDREIQWDIVREVLRIPHDGSYRAPKDEHGTHVAGVLAGDWRTGDDDMPDEYDMLGMCPGLDLYDIRVIKDDGTGDEFSINTALQFVRHLNSRSDQMAIHGVNLSITVPIDVANFASGRTPVCEQCERLVASGVVTVVPAGNDGHQTFVTSQSGGGLAAFAGFHDISITDPGNAEGVITVGATHRSHPHTYGISFFSSRGPTADGRQKPDLVAPGEKIVGPVPGNGSKPLDGTSMAVPHVSGAAAALMARHRELRGQPNRIKRILMESATDLGRVPHFQGAGLVDAFRALQSV